jgi:hypothetical protein
VQGTSAKSEREARLTELGWILVSIAAFVTLTAVHEKLSHQADCRGLSSFRSEANAVSCRIIGGPDWSDRLASASSPLYYPFVCRGLFGPCQIRVARLFWRHNGLPAPILQRPFPLILSSHSHLLIWLILYPARAGFQNSDTCPWHRSSDIQMFST